MSFIEFKNVSKIYKTGEIEIKAVDNISFPINRGEFVVIVGPSGAGKTTVLNILGGMDDVTSGEVVVDGRTHKKESIDIKKDINTELLLNYLSFFLSNYHQ